MKFWFSEPGEKKEVYLKGFENAIKRHMIKVFILNHFWAFCLKLMVVHAVKRSTGNVGREIKGPRPDVVYVS